ncbi:MAG TPA: DUF433 domain-containing protein [Caulobacteraceae bacterium]|jgi:uncharacterized protein (DUF433 family)|nr:DUF433 domain-containing protein [Caulobacteraceae bacterium]
MTHERIHRDPKVMMGKPVIRGTRITVELLLRECAGGLTIAEITHNYPHITEADIRAALAYAADYLSHEGLIAAE